MTIHKILKDQICQRLITEGVSRIRTCLTFLSEEDLWYKPNVNTNSIGNQILHLEGNVRQWLLLGLGNVAYERKRDLEFSSRFSHNITELKIVLNTLEQDILDLDIAELDLISSRSIQGFEETSLSVIIHVIEHFSYHVGQITMMTKILKDVDTGYYKDLDLTII